eukprot:1261811-Rhodomonas_salina.1
MSSTGHLVQGYFSVGVRDVNRCVCREEGEEEQHSLGQYRTPRSDIAQSAGGRGKEARKGREDGAGRGRGRGREREREGGRGREE